MGKWFPEGLDEESLKKKYRELAKQYHPDINQSPEASEIMKEINAEFDDYVHIYYPEATLDDLIHDRRVLVEYLLRNHEGFRSLYTLAKMMGFRY